MIKQNQIKEAITSKKDIFNAFIYLKNCRSRKTEVELLSCLDKNSLRNINFALKLISFIAKDLIIALDLISARNQVFFTMFDYYTPDLNKEEIKKVIEDSKNHWLSMDYAKLKIFRDFCDSFLKDSYICERICALIDGNEDLSESSRDVYYQCRKEVLDILNDLIDISEKDFNQQKMLDMYIKAGNVGKLHITPEEGQSRVDKYNEALNDNSLLGE